MVDKPTGIHSVILDGNTEALSVARSLLEQHPELAKVSEKATDSGLVHRLDFETSGLLLGAKTKESWKQMRVLMQSERVTKHYLAILEGKIENSFSINAPIGSRYRGSKKVTVYDDRKPKRSREASTHFCPENYFDKYDSTLCRISIHAGQRHQIRAHASHSGHPLVGDSLYNSSRTIEELGIVNHPPKFFLHASEIEGEHPLNGDKLSLSVEIPPKFLRLLA